MNIHQERIESLRSFMRSRNIDAVVIYGSDPHISEYPALRWKQVEWLTGFTGEAGDVVITLDHAGLWTDSRYFIQANDQLSGTGAVLHKTRIPGAVGIPEWLEGALAEDAIVAVDSLCTSVGALKSLQARFEVVCIPDLLNMLWEDRPAIVQTPVFTVNPGESREEKIDWLRGVMAARGCDYMVICALDEIAWLLNVRASDVEYNPVVISYLLVGQDELKWFVLKDDIEDETTQNTVETLRHEGVEVCGYEEVFIDLQTLTEGTIWLDEDAVNAELYSSIRCDRYCAPSPVQARKAVKNPLEIENIREAHIRDGVAMEKFLHWLETAIAQGRQINEWEAALKQREFRAQIDDYMGDSFETISAYGPGAALPHYHTPSQNAPVLKPCGLYLNDSGGQYLSGTTDITRTVPLGPCTKLERRDYTLVLKSHIDLATAVFPEGTPGCRLDAAARLPLWREYRDFGHGTGHGVGYFLGVHEGPCQIRQNMDPSPLKAGMVTSDEPGIYREGEFGVRHENLLLVVEAQQNEFGKFLRFEPLTMCHYDTSVLDLSLLDGWEIDWLDGYNRMVLENVGPFLDEEERKWLELKTKPLHLE